MTINYSIKLFVAVIFSLIIGCVSDRNNFQDQDVIEAEWEIIWSDEFNEDEIDSSKWNKLLWKSGHVNNEQQAYTDRDTNIFIRNGKLVIRGLIEPGYYGVDYLGNSYTADYTSGRVNTYNKANWTYGKFDIHAKLPKGNGSWPAIWMLGENISSVGWPNCGEIDIMEHVGFEDGKIHGSIHTSQYNHMLGTQLSGSKIISTATDTFHTYSLEWSPTYLRYLIDDEPFYFIYNMSDGDKSKWPFDDSQYLILNLAIGGDWGGIYGVDPSAFPMEMEVDYVHVLKRNAKTPDIQVTFQVNMEHEYTSGTGVRLSGGTISSGLPDGIQMAQVAEDNDIWEVTLILPPNSTFSYKYRNGFIPNSWDGYWELIDEECQLDSNGNRIIELGANDTTLTPVCFGECAPCD